MIADLTARPIRFTDDLPAWQRLLGTLGARLIVERPGWLVYAVGSGRVALHQASDHQPPGAALAFETTTLIPEAVAEAAAAGVPITLGHPDHGEAGMVEASDGIRFTLDSPTPVETVDQEPDPRLVSLPIWYGPDTAMVRQVLQGLGARPHIVGDDEEWVSLSCEGGGLVAAHGAERPAVELAFEWDGDVEEALALLTAAGIDADLIDETYARTLQVADPDGIKTIWINERQTDFYGYRAARS